MNTPQIYRASLNTVPTCFWLNKLGCKPMETLYWTELTVIYYYSNSGCYHRTSPPQIAISMDPAEQGVNIVGISSTRGSISLSIKRNTIWRRKQWEMTRMWLIFYKMVSTKRSWYKAVFFIYYREWQMEFFKQSTQYSEYIQLEHFCNYVAI